MRRSSLCPAQLPAAHEESGRTGTDTFVRPTCVTCRELSLGQAPEAFSEGWLKVRRRAGEWPSADSRAFSLLWAARVGFGVWR